MAMNIICWPVPIAVMRCDCKVLNLCPTALSLKWQASCCGRAGPGIGLLYSADCSLLWATAAGSGWLRLLRPRPQTFLLRHFIRLKLGILETWYAIQHDSWKVETSAAANMKPSFSAHLPHNLMRLIATITAPLSLSGRHCLDIN